MFRTSLTDALDLSEPARTDELRKLSAKADSAEKHRMLGLANLDIAKSQIEPQSAPNAALAAGHLRRAVDFGSADEQHEARYGLFLACLLGGARDSAISSLRTYPLLSCVTGEQKVIVEQCTELQTPESHLE